MKLILSLTFTAGLLLAGATSASAMMAPPAPHSHAAGLIQVRDGCGRGYHENRHGRCVENDGDDSAWDDHHRHGDGCDRWHHWSHGHCVRNW
ncbi:MAG TPA: hypothetical protein VII56_01840 [Rhizomicrobium sp.]